MMHTIVFSLSDDGLLFPLQKWCASWGRAHFPKFAILILLDIISILRCCIHPCSTDTSLVLAGIHDASPERSTR